MDNKRLFLAMILSVAILAVFQWFMPHHTPHQTAKQVEASSTRGTPSTAASQPGYQISLVTSTPGPEHDTS